MHRGHPPGCRLDSQTEKGATLFRFLIGCLMLVSETAVLHATAADSAVELRYSGSLTQVRRGDAGTPVRQFDVYALLQPTDEGYRVFHVVEERGEGGWAWPERFGDLVLDAGHRSKEGRPAHLLHTHDGVHQPIELPSPLFEYASRLAPNAEWTSGKLAYAISRERNVAGRDCWQVDATDNFGRRQTFAVQKGEPYLVSAERRVFMGRGDEFTLRIELASSRPVTGDAFARLSAATDALRTLQTELNRPKGETRPELSTEQIGTASQAMETLLKLADGTPLKPLVEAISRDVRTQMQRSGDLTSLAKKFVGQPTPAFRLTSLTKDVIDSTALAGRITVLHFWEYQGEPLEEPYGQVGYLDFLRNRRSRFNVDVVGIAVNEAFGEASTSGPALRSVRRMRDFMNIGYPITTDDGKTLARFGDPRSLGAKLPMWVVIGPDGKIAHYHIGFYAINPDEGLQELDAVVVKLAREHKTGGDSPAK